MPRKQKRVIVDDDYHDDIIFGMEEDDDELSVDPEEIASSPRNRSPSISKHLARSTSINIAAPRKTFFKSHLNSQSTGQLSSESDIISQSLPVPHNISTPTLNIPKKPTPSLNLSPEVLSEANTFPTLHSSRVPKKDWFGMDGTLISKSPKSSRKSSSNTNIPVGVSHSYTPKSSKLSTSNEKVRFKLKKEKKSKKSKQKEMENPHQVLGVALDLLMDRERQLGSMLTCPKLVLHLLAVLRNQGLEARGLFRQCGHHQTQLEKEALINSGCEELGLEALDIHTTAALLKSFLRNLPMCLVPRMPHFSILVQASALADQQSRLTAYKAVVDCLPPNQLNLFGCIIQFLSEVASFSEKNLMTSSNLSLIFAPLFFGTLEDDINVSKEAIDPMALCKETKFTANITQQLIDNPQIFEPPYAPARAYQAAESVKLENTPSILRGDTLVVFRSYPNESVVLLEGTPATIPTEALETMIPISLHQVKTKNISSLFTNKPSISRQPTMTHAKPISPLKLAPNGKPPKGERRSSFTKFTQDVLRINPSPKRSTSISQNSPPTSPR